jgi:hypothetical protein
MAYYGKGTSGNILTDATAPDMSKWGSAAAAGAVTSVVGTANEITVTPSGSPSGTIVTLSTPAAFIAPGSITSTTFTTVTLGNLTVTAGNAIITAGNLTLPNTTSGAGNGIISFGGNTWISNYGTENTFVGQFSGNTTLTTGSAIQNTGVGYNCLPALTTGTLNTACGSQCMLDMQSGSNNTAMGQNCLEHSVSDSNNCCFGFQAGRLIAGGSTNAIFGYQAGDAITTGGSNAIFGGSSGTAYTSSESGNIILGEGIAGTIGESNITRIGGSSQTACYVTGIDGVNVGSVAKVVTEASNQLGTATLTAGANITITPTANTITIASTGGGGLTTITGTLTNSQIKNLHGTPIQVIAAAGSGKVIACVSCWMKLIYGGTNAFTASASQQIYLTYGSGTGINFCGSQLMPNSAIVDTKNNYSSIGIGGSVQDIAATSLENVGIYAYNNVATEISGNAADDNTISYSITYYVITI